VRASRRHAGSGARRRTVLIRKLTAARRLDVSAPPDRSVRRRLDVALVERGLAPTRARARDLVLRGAVRIDGHPAAKPAMLVDGAARIDLPDAGADYVSRGGLKLAAALAHFAFSPAGRVALDIGASTGGFTEVLLKAGAHHVFAVENGSGQLHPRLVGDPRVTSLERTDARTLDAATIPAPVAAIVADVSFISLTKVLPAPLALAAPGCWLVALIKPQFEGEPGTIPRDGVVKDEVARAAAVARVERFLAEQAGWRVRGVMPSPIHGGSGNVEYLIGAVHDG
jgi:23S rRNA (cytidine1920-2'-O)/16S rRNA (cytidine1409-2'-O)-methyltransferase